MAGKKKDQEAGGTKTVIALSAIEHDGEKFAEGEEIECTAQQAAELVAGGAAKVKGAKAAETENEGGGQS